MLSRFVICLSEIRTFLEMKNVEHPELADTEWLLKFCYLVAMTEHLNQLNVKIKAFEIQSYPCNKQCLHLKTSWNFSSPTLKQVVYYTLKNLESLKMHAQQVTLLKSLVFSS